MSDFGDIGISKNCQSYPKWHESIFEDWIFWNIIFKNRFCLKNPKIFAIKNSKKFRKKFKMKNRKKNLMCGKIFYIARLLKLFSENEIIENWSMAVGVWLFHANLKGLLLGCVILNWIIWYI